MSLNSSGILGVSSFEESGNLTTNETEVAISQHTARFATNIFREGCNCMLQGWTCSIAEWVFKKVASLDIHEKEGIAVPTNGRTSTIDNIVVKDIPKKGRGLSWRCVTATFGKSGYLTIIPNRVTTQVREGDVGLC